MAVHLTRIYTKTGDDGTTALGDGSRVRKTDVRLAAYADTDECNAALGVAVTVGGLAEELLVPLRQVQNDLFDVGADLSTPIAINPKYPPLRITDDYVTRLENWCDAFNEQLPTLDSFILPGGTPGAAHLHVGLLRRRARARAARHLGAPRGLAAPLARARRAVGVGRALLGVADVARAVRHRRDLHLVRGVGGHRARHLRRRPAGLAGDERA
jgi:cob(I)alamin adenosyltransferase